MAIYKGSTKVSGVEVVSNIDDTASSASTTYSSEKIEEKLEAVNDTIKVDYYEGVAITETTIESGQTAIIDTGLNYEANGYSAHMPLLFRYAAGLLCTNYGVNSSGNLEIHLYNQFSVAVTVNKVWFYLFSGFTTDTNLTRHGSI